MPTTSGPDHGFTREDLRTWLKLNRKGALAGLNSSDVCERAILCGFSQELVCEVLSHFGDAMRGSSIDNRADMMIETELWTINQMRGPYCLEEQWRSLGQKLLYDKDFDEGTTPHA